MVLLFQIIWPREQTLVLISTVQHHEPQQSPEVNVYNYRLLGMLGEEASKLTCKFLMKLNCLYQYMYIYIHVVLQTHLQ